ncbi:MAG: hypothetical protein ACW98F_09190 [Candidatus Hodarchaeales archaeon]
MRSNSLIQTEFAMAWNEWIHGHDTKAVEIWYSILRKYPDSENDQISVDVMNYLAMYERIWEGRIQTEIDITKNKKNAEIINYSKGEADSLIEIALRSKSQDETLLQFQTAQDIYERLNDKEGLIKLNYQYGMYLVNRGFGKFGQIFNKFQIALQHAIETNRNYYKALIHHGIGEAFLRLENIEEASHHFEIASQIFIYLKNERKIIEVLVSKADVESQNQQTTSPDKLVSVYEEFNRRIEKIQGKIPKSALFGHLSRFCDLFLDFEDYKQINALVADLDAILRQTNIKSRLYFQGKMSLALIKGNIQLKMLNFTNAEDLYNYILRRRGEAKITDLYGALISLAIISLYKYRIFFDSVHLSEAQSLIQDAIKISETTDHVRGFLRASVVNVMLKISVGDLDDIDEMEQIIKSAQEKGLITEARRAQKEINRLKHMIRTQNLTEDRSVEKILQYALEAKRLVWKDQ